jgi:hypothetical protein
MMNEQTNSGRPQGQDILQCGLCHRQHDGAGKLLPFRACLPVLQECGRGDCAEVVAHLLAVERQRRQERFDRIQAARPVLAHGHQKQRQFSSRCDKSEARQPFKEDDREMMVAPSVVVTPPLSQAEYVASGQADSQNAKLLEFLSLPKNFNQWIKSTFLEELSGATRMNNRAVDLRPTFIARGHYLDNCMKTDAGTERKASYYRVCNIEEALSLTTEQKNNLLMEARNA